MRYIDSNTTEKISKIGLGTWQFGSSEWGYSKHYDDQVARAIVRRALELGVTLFDTAEIYGFGQSERILGRALGADADAVIVATKMFPVMPGARIVRRRAAASMRRMRVSRLDLYQVHWPSPLVPDRRTMRGMAALQRMELIGEVGVSNYSLRRWRAAEKALGSRILTNQVSYSLVARAPERDLLPFAEAHGRIIIAYSPLAHGLLSGRYDRDRRPTDGVRMGSPLFFPDSLDRARGLVELLREVAEAHSATPAQIALAWAIRSPAVVAIPGASSVEQLESNAASAEIQLRDDEYLALRKASDRFCPDAVPRASHRRSLSERKSAVSFAAKHSAKGAWYVAKTSRRDYKLGHSASE